MCICYSYVFSHCRRRCSTIDRKRAESEKNKFTVVHTCSVCLGRVSHKSNSMCDIRRAVLLKLSPWNSIKCVMGRPYSIMQKLEIMVQDYGCRYYQHPCRRTYARSPEWFSLYWVPWWRHQMEIFSALLAICAGNSPVTGEFLAQRLVTRSFDVFFDVRLNKQLNQQSRDWWFETL